MRRVALLLVFLLGCGKPFTPASVVNGFRVLGMSADSPEIHPGDQTRIHALVADAKGDVQATLLWLGCQPDPLDLGRSSCSNEVTLQDPLSLIQFADGGAAELPPGMTGIGFDQNASYGVSADAGLFEGIPAGDPRRIVGTVGQVLMIAIDEPFSLTDPPSQQEKVFEDIKDGTTPAIIALFRVLVSENPQPNHNPLISGLLVNGAPLFANQTLTVDAGASVTLDVSVQDGGFETYTEYLPDGTTQTQQERMLAAWYSTAGSLSQESVELGSNVTETYSAADPTDSSPLPPGTRGTLWMVLRDNRGGESWTEAPTFVCDSSSTADGGVPSAIDLTPDAGPANGALVLRLDGQNLGNVVDVLLMAESDGGSVPAGAALIHGAYSALDGGFGYFEGNVPVLPSGPYSITLVGKDCQPRPTGLTFTATQ